MFRALAFGMGFGAAFQAWRAFPPGGPLTADGVAVVFVVGLVCAYVGGRWHGRHNGPVAFASASASAQAAATSSSTVQLAVVMPGGGAHAAGVAFPTAEAPWLAGATVRPEITESDLEGMELSDFNSEHETELHET